MTTVPFHFIVILKICLGYSKAPAAATGQDPAHFDTSETRTRGPVQCSSLVQANALRTLLQRQTA